MRQLFCGSLFLFLFFNFVPEGIAQSDSNLDRILHKISAQEDYLGALADLERLLEKPDPDPSIYFQIGICHNLLRNYSKALEHLQKARERGISGWELSLGFGIAHFHLAHATQAREEFEKSCSEPTRGNHGSVSLGSSGPHGRTPRPGREEVSIGSEPSARSPGCDFQSGQRFDEAG